MDDNRIDRMEKMIEDLIRIIGNTNSIVADTNKNVIELAKRMDLFEQRMATRLEAIESHLYRMQLLERRQDKMSARLEKMKLIWNYNKRNNDGSPSGLFSYVRDSSRGTYV